MSNQWEPDGWVAWRWSEEHGARIAVLPRRCLLGLHDLAEVGYDTERTEWNVLRSSQVAEVLYVRCRACGAGPMTPHKAWTLRTGDMVPPAVVLDDAPYEELRADMYERGLLRAPGGSRRPPD